MSVIPTKPGDRAASSAWTSKRAEQDSGAGSDFAALMGAAWLQQTQTSTQSAMPKGIGASEENTRRLSGATAERAGNSTNNRDVNGQGNNGADGSPTAEGREADASPSPMAGERRPEGRSAQPQGSAKNAADSEDATSASDAMSQNDTYDKQSADGNHQGSQTDNERRLTGNDAALARRQSRLVRQPINSARAGNIAATNNGSDRADMMRGSLMAERNRLSESRDSTATGKDKRDAITAADAGDASTVRLQSQTSTDPIALTPVEAPDASHASLQLDGRVLDEATAALTGGRARTDLTASQGASNGPGPQAATDTNRAAFLTAPLTGGVTAEASGLDSAATSLPPIDAFAKTLSSASTGIAADRDSVSHSPQDTRTASVQGSALPAVSTNGSSPSTGDSARITTALQSNNAAGAIGSQMVSASQGPAATLSTGAGVAAATTTANASISTGIGNTNGQSGNASNGTTGNGDTQVASVKPDGVKSTAADTATAARLPADRSRMGMTNPTDARSNADSLGSSIPSPNNTMMGTAVPADKSASERSVSPAGSNPVMSPAVLGGLNAFQAVAAQDEPPRLVMSTPITEPGFADELHDTVQLVSTRGLQSVEISITPAELGPIKLKVDMTGNQAEVRFEAAQETTRTLLAEAVPALKEQLAQSGIDLRHATVDRNAAWTGGQSSQGNLAQGGNQQGTGQQGGQQGNNARYGDANAQNIGASVRDASAQAPGQRVRNALLDTYA